MTQLGPATHKDIFACCFCRSVFSFSSNRTRTDALFKWHGQRRCRSTASMRAATLKTKLLPERAEPREKYHASLERVALEVRPPSGLFHSIKMYIEFYFYILCFHIYFCLFSSTLMAFLSLE